MSFLGWTFLFGAAAVVGPILAHLLAKPRFRRVPFTMLQFLRIGRHESHSRRKLRDLLVLLLRCAIIVLIAVLFARPVLKIKAAPRPHKAICHLGLDDSASMAYLDGRSSLFERMGETAIECVRRAPDDAVFCVCGLASGRLAQGLNRSQAVAEIKRLVVVPKSARLAEFAKAVETQYLASQPGDTVSATVLSDFTPDVLRRFGQIRTPAIVDTISHEIISPASPVNNAAVVDARAIDVVENKLDVDVVIANPGDIDQRRRLVAVSGALQSVTLDVALAPREQRIVRMQMDLGPGVRDSAHSGLPLELSLEPGDGLAWDDTYHLAVVLPAAASTKIAVVHRAEEAFLFETAVGALAGQASAGALSLRKVPESRLGASDLDWANGVVFSSLPSDSSCPISLLKSFLARGGRLIFFAAQAGDPQVSESLLREGLLAALPQKWMPGVVYPEPQPAAGGGIVLGEQAARVLANYRFDRIALKGYWLCRTPPEAECLWRLANGAGFVYGRSAGSGSTILVNTSIDDSLGLLAKSGAWVAFCRALVGAGDRIHQFCFEADDRPVLTVPEAMRVAGRASIGIENCDGSKARAAVDGIRVLLPLPRGTGWMRTLGAPVLHAGINLPGSETDPGRPAPEAVADAMKRVFVIDPGRRRMAANAGVPTQSKPIWKAFAWATLLLLLLEPAVTNRLKR